MVRRLIHILVTCPRCAGTGREQDGKMCSYPGCGGTGTVMKPVYVDE